MHVLVVLRWSGLVFMLCGWVAYWFTRVYRWEPGRALTLALFMIGLTASIGAFIVSIGRA